MMSWAYAEDVTEAGQARGREVARLDGRPRNPAPPVRRLCFFTASLPPAPRQALLSEADAGLAPLRIVTGRAGTEKCASGGTVDGAGSQAEYPHLRTRYSPSANVTPTRPAGRGVGSRSAQSRTVQ